jgi:hypothetical protein
MGNRGDRCLDNTNGHSPPLLEFLFEAHAAVSQPLEIGPLSTGRRLIASLEPGGWFEGPRMRGSILPGSTVSELVHSDGIVEVEGRTLLEMEDGNRIFLVTNGIISMPAEAAQALAEGRPYDPASIYSRSFARFEAADDGPYAWLKHGLYITQWRRTTDGIVSTIWRIL